MYEALSYYILVYVALSYYILVHKALSSLDTKHANLLRNNVQRFFVWKEPDKGAPEARVTKIFSD